MPRPDELPPDRATWISKRNENERPLGRNKELKELIKQKMEWMQELEAAHKDRMQFLASEIEYFQYKLNELEQKDKLSVQ